MLLQNLKNASDAMHGIVTITIVQFEVEGSYNGKVVVDTIRKNIFTGTIMEPVGTEKVFTRFPYTAGRDCPYFLFSLG